MIVSAIILFVLILVSGVLSSSEIAVSSSNRNKVKMLADKGDKRAIRLLNTLNRPHRFFATTQLYYTFIAFFSGAYAASSFTPSLAGFAIRMGLPVSQALAEAVAFIIVTAILTYVTLILGELVPKRIAMRYAIPFALRILPVLNVLSIMALPFVKLLASSARFVLRLIGFKDNTSEAVPTKEEIRLMVESSSEHGHIAESEHGMIENIFKIDTLTAGDICTHRLDIVALPLDADFKAVVDTLVGKYFSRVPVYEESLDDIRGFLHSKDILHYMAGGADPAKFQIKELMREAHFVPLSKKADELFQEMRKERAFIAVVLDEYGGTMGIVTMEDLVEKIVGSIQDEYDSDEQPDIAPLGPDTVRVQGVANLEVLQNHFEIPLPLTEYETVSGFLVGQLRHIPAEEEKPEITFNGLQFTVESIQEKRVATVIVKKLPVERKAEGDE